MGKSTLILQAGSEIARRAGRVLYVTGEESEEQIHFRAVRTGAVADELFVVSETDVVHILDEIQGMEPVFVIVDSVAALYIHQTRPTLRHLTVVNNQYGAWCFGNALPTIQHSIFWNNSVADIDHHPGYVPDVSFSCIQRSFPGVGNIDADPLFVNPVDPDPNKRDFHLQSRHGRYLPGNTRERRPEPENWVLDSQTSPCIDAGDELKNPMQETMPNGGRINMGAYGNTPFAGKSPWPLPADLNYNGDVWLEDLLIFTENWLPPH